MITGYIISALKYAIVFCFLYIIAKKIYLKHNGKKFVLKSEILYIIFGAYIVALLSQTIIPIWNIFFVDGKFLIEISTYNSRGLNIIPFKTILDYLTGSNDFYGDANLTIRIVNLLGNICLFVPFGFLFPMIFNKFSKIQITLSFGILLSVFIEVMQFFIKRSSDIDDIILNCIGVFLGFMCYKTLSVLSIRYCMLEAICKEAKKIEVRKENKDIIFYQLAAARYGKDFMKFNIEWYKKLINDAEDEEL